MRKAVIVGLVFLLVVVVCMTTYIIVYSATVRRPTRAQILLQRVGIEDGIDYEELKYDYWKDPLSYVSGYEILAVKLDSKEWNIPAGWNCSDVLYDTLFIENGFNFNERIFQEIGVIGTTFQEWYYEECGQDGYFKDWEYIIALYNREGLLLLYRGHNLYSDLMLRL